MGLRILKFVRNQTERLFPGGLLKHIVFLYQRSLQSLLTDWIGLSIPSFLAVLSFTYRMIFPGFHTHQVAVFDHQVYTASTTTVGTNRGDMFNGWYQCTAFPSRMGWISLSKFRAADLVEIQIQHILMKNPHLEGILKINVEHRIRYSAIYTKDKLKRLPHSTFEVERSMFDVQISAPEITTETWYYIEIMYVSQEFWNCECFKVWVLGVGF